MARPDFSLLWSKNNVPEPILDSDYELGWAFIGSEPPRRSEFDFFQRKINEQTNWIGSQIPTDSGVISKTFNSVADLDAANDVFVGQTVKTLGYYAPGDGGGADYEIVAAGTGTADGGTFIDLAGSGHQAKGLFSESIIDVKLFGVRSTDTPAQQAAAISALLAATSFFEYRIGHDLNYGLVQGEGNPRIDSFITMPNRDFIIYDQSIESGYTPPAHQGAQTRIWYNYEDATDGLHNGFNYLEAAHHIGDFYSLTGDGITTDGTTLARNATTFYGIDTLAYWGNGMGARDITLATPGVVTPTELLEATGYKIVAGNLRGTPGLTTVMHISNITGNVSWFGEVNAPYKYDFASRDEDINHQHVKRRISATPDLFPEEVVLSSSDEAWKTTYTPTTKLFTSPDGGFMELKNDVAVETRLRLAGGAPVASVYIEQTGGKKIELRVNADGSSELLTTAGSRYTFTEDGNLLAAQGVSGNTTTTAGRPAANLLANGTMMFDTDLGKPIWLPSNLSNTWVDATGTVV